MRRITPDDVAVMAADRPLLAEPREKTPTGRYPTSSRPGEAIAAQEDLRDL
ncbi:MAG: hypothetical protein ACXV1K_11170 [Kineosporiaceae bacterium]